MTKLEINAETLTYPANIINNLCMLGRILTYQKCPICKKPFTVLSKEKGIICPEHKTVPERFYINANQLQAGRLYSDPQGNPFTGFYMAHRQLEAMRREVDAKVFNLDEWIPKKTRYYRFEVLAEEWLRGYEIEVKGQTKANSYVRRLKQCMKDYLIPEWQKMDIRDIKEPQIRKFYHDLLERELASKTVKHILNILRIFLGTHIQTIKIMPSMPKFRVIPKRPKKWIGIDKQFHALSYIPIQHSLIFEVLFDTGMRPGEVRALKSGDLRDGYITISRAFSENTLRETTKTGNEISCKVSFSLWTKLIKHIQGLDPGELIFTDKGKPYHCNKLYMLWKATCKKAGIEYITLYQASRHSAVSQIRQKKETEALQEAADKLGHADRKTTKQFYSLNGSKEIK